MNTAKTRTSSRPASAMAWSWERISSASPLLRGSPPSRIERRLLDPLRHAVFGQLEVGGA